jgi:hypothetical protein
MRNKTVHDTLVRFVILRDFANSDRIEMEQGFSSPMQGLQAVSRVF